MARTGFLSHPACLDHDTGPSHPERPARLRAIRELLEASGLLQELVALEPQEIDDRRLRLLHDPRYLDFVERGCAAAPAILDAGDTVVSSGSLRAARLAAGAVVGAVEAVLDGSLDNAFVCCRPPGHHAERGAALGFCLYNNVALGAAYLRREKGLDRVAILDFDVHHGNGTQHAFEADPTVYFASLHQWPHYPGTGAASERGVGSGSGTVRNCPMAAGSGDAEWVGTLERDVLPELEQFRPDFLLVSAGFDAHALDPLSGTRVTEEGFRLMTQRCVELANHCCQGRLVTVLEGGYHLPALSRSVQAHLEELRAAPERRR